MRVAVVVPVKAFTHAKQRLAAAMDDRSRADLARWCAERVIAAAEPLERFVVCDDDEVEAWASGLGATPIRCDEPGLNAAITASVATLATLGVDTAIVAHGDLPLARRLDHVALAGTVCAVPDHRYDGTNVLALPTALAGSFRFQYGRGSFRRHVRETLRLAAPARVLRDDDLAQDLDTPADLADQRMHEVLEWLRTNQASPR